MKTRHIFAQLPTLLLLTLMLCLTGLKAQNDPNLPAGWEYTESPNMHGMIVFLGANPTINDYELQPGDYIGAFYVDDFGALKCAGADFWSGTDNIIFPIFGDDPATAAKDGFGYAETMQFKVFSQLTQKAYDASEISWDYEYPTTNKWYPLGLSAITELVCSVAFDAYISANINPACVGQEITLTASLFAGSNENLTYTWWSEPGGFSSNEETIVVEPTDTTKYFVTVSNGVLSSGHQKEIVIHHLPVAMCGDDLTICTEDCALLHGDAVNYSEILWVTSGDGCFCDPANPETMYTPGPMDIQTGEVTVNFYAAPLSACNIASNDNLDVTILELPSIGIEDMMAVCENDEMLLDAGAENYSQIAWSTGGDGTFDSPNSATTNYYPGTNDYAAQQVQVTVSATALEPLTLIVSKEVTILLQQAATVNSPSTRIVCSNDPLYINAVAFNYSNAQWSTSGDGTFENPEALNTNYYPGEQDKVSGGAALTVTVFGKDLCQTFPAVSQTEIIIIPSPEIEMEDELTITEAETCLINAVVSGTNEVNWNTSGDGTFEIFSTGLAEYFPGGDDIENGQVEISASAVATYPCISGASQTLLLHIHRIHQIEMPAGWTSFSSYINKDETIENLFAPIISNLIIAQNQSGVFWPEGGVNTLDDFSCLSGYKLKLENPQALTIVGPKSQNPVIDILSGWNLIPVISTGSIDCQSIVNQLGSNLIIIKEVAGTGVVWPAMNISTINAFEPGRAYMVAVEATCQLNYGICTGFKSLGMPKVPFINNTPWPTPEQTTNTHTIAFSGEVLNSLEPGDVVAAFNQAGLCTGMAEYTQHGRPFALVVNGDEAITSETEGMAEGETMRFKVLRSKSEIFHLEITESLRSVNPISHFVTNGISVAESVYLKSASTENSISHAFSVYPNPSTGIFQISTGEDSGNITISDLNGKTILEQEVNNNTRIDMGAFPRGMYIISLTGNNSRHIEKLILSD